jgi:hypothetical protein
MPSGNTGGGHYAHMGRVASVTVMAVTTGVWMLVMPPFLSFRVESNIDIAAVLFQTVVGFAVAAKSPVRTPHTPTTIVHWRPQPGDRLVQRQYPLDRITCKIIEQNSELFARRNDIEVDGEVDPMM